MKHEQKIPFMAKVKDKATGLTGSVTAYLVFMNGCVQYAIEFLNKDKDAIPSIWLDEDRLEVLSEEAVPAKAAAPTKGTKGGPSRGPALH